MQGDLPRDVQENPGTNLIQVVLCLVLIGSKFPVPPSVTENDPPHGFSVSIPTPGSLHPKYPPIKTLSEGVPGVVTPFPNLFKNSGQKF